ncbi:hypothetical protein [Candidatus Nanohalobium constans]|uniref:Uncharacterized protein n=1 Tax=Candidatus Nanohalobium constans TaxID=2565781 RepID=A0A5Q0UG31_9ARCH|nr:hypothetical protein [Candidatus Nanohalobium constans]QGA80514.1 hypothetical protein LC1Nh_0621 [Candidatus Nanohalobium constans]
MVSNKIFVSASALADKAKNKKSYSHKEQESELIDTFSLPELGEGFVDSNNQIDDLASTMGRLVSFGFHEHDDGNMDAAEVYFIAKDALMFGKPVKEGEILPEDLVEAAVSYSDALEAKDCHEWAQLDRETKLTLAEDFEMVDQYLDSSTEELYRNTTSEEKDLLGVRDVDSENLEDLWNDIVQDHEGLNFVKGIFERREDALGIREGLYSEHELWWLDHKAVDFYSTDCAIARYAELEAATGLDQFGQQALSLIDARDGSKAEAVGKSMKPSDGIAGPGLLASMYLTGVEAHDSHGVASKRAMPELVAPYYKATLLPQFADSYSVEDLREYAATYHSGNIEEFAEAKSIEQDPKMFV